ncbi:MAG: hypothetical protein IT439_03025 [Phycisphaerales bacterium]|nr:hypothetical protein [Phycisphaerales bacterium]
MPLIYVGIDEAGYGPMLGPLCVGLAVFRVEGWAPGNPPPDLWALLAKAVTRAPESGRLAINDSKKLKIQSGPRHPLTHLERGVLAMLGTAGEPAPATDADLLARLRTRWPSAPWYGGPALSLPRAGGADRVRLDINLLSRALDDTGVRVLGLGCEVIGEGEFNEILRLEGSKGATTLAGLARHLRRVRDEHAGADVRIVCDRLGGRTSYAEVLRAALGVSEVTVIEQSARVSRYDAAGLGVLFQPEAEQAHLPVALASMVAKLLRELAMERFNRSWAARMPELKPTAGYVTDARRWLSDASGVIEPAEREAMIRRA